MADPLQLVADADRPARVRGARVARVWDGPLATGDHVLAVPEAGSSVRVLEVRVGDEARSVVVGR